MESPENDGMKKIAGIMSTQPIWMRLTHGKFLSGKRSIFK